MEKCNPRGRDCIEENFTLTFNCSVNCEGIYADVQWMGEKVERKIGKRGVEQDKKKYRRLITEYNHFKENIVQHFRFNDTAGSNFGKFQYFSMEEFSLSQERRYQVPPIFPVLLLFILSTYIAILPIPSCLC